MKRSPAQVAEWKRLRAEQGLTLAEIARRVGVSTKTISRGLLALSNGNGHAPPASELKNEPRLERLAAAIRAVVDGLDALGNIAFRVGDLEHETNTLLDALATARELLKGGSR